MAIYACSDLHGNGNLWNQIKDFLQPDDTLYYLGDAVDRGPDGWRILIEMLTDERVNFIVGNHEIMLADRIINPYDYDIANLHHHNGGKPTWLSAENDPEAMQVAYRIYSLPKYAIYENVNGLKIFMSHSGSTNIWDEKELIWDRHEYVRSKNDTEYDKIIHGHTPIEYLVDDLREVAQFFDIQHSLPDWEGGAYWYHGFRCDIDCLTAATHETVLLNLDTFEQKIFKV